MALVHHSSVPSGRPSTLTPACFSGRPGRGGCRRTGARGLGCRALLPGEPRLGSGASSPRC
eukprot:2712212-Rhodomonas_salina.2